MRPELPKRRMTGKILLRLAYKADSSPATAGGFNTALSNSSLIRKFGVEHNSIMDYCRKHPEIAIDGLHLHPGSRIARLDTFREALGSLHRLADGMEAELGRKMRVINIGGGLAGSYLPEMPPPTIASLVAALAPMLRSRFEYFVEPGNSLVGDTMCLITKVVMVKRDNGSAIAVMDVGYDQLIYHRPFHLRTSEHQDLPDAGKDVVAGPLCFSGDIIRSATTLDGIKRGDCLYLPFVGAYCYAASNHFNGRQYGGMVVWDGQSISACNSAEDFRRNSIFSTDLRRTGNASEP